jgi:transcriptional regulator with XRE-family HTH domain
MREVGAEIRRRRLERSWSGAQLAVYAGMAPSAISQIETGRRSPNAGSLEKIAMALQVEVVDLFPKAQVPLPEIQEYGALLEERGFPSEQIAAYLAQNEPELENMSAKDFLEALLAEPGFRKIYDHYRKSEEGASTPPRSESA